VPHDRTHQRRLAGAVAADQADHGAPGHVHRKAAQRRHRLDLDHEIVDLEQGAAFIARPR
jgi:hypothetical protein